jgi:hypothetical protein
MILSSNHWTIPAKFTGFIKNRGAIMRKMREHCVDLADKVERKIRKIKWALMIGINLKELNSLR